MRLLPWISRISNISHHSASGKLITKVSEATPKDVDAAVDAAHKAYENAWGLNVPGAQRAALLNKLADLMVAHKNELAAIEALDNGKHCSLTSPGGS